MRIVDFLRVQTSNVFASNLSWMVCKRGTACTSIAASTHIHEEVPEEYQKCMVGMKSNFKQTLEIAETASHPKIKLQARVLLMSVTSISWI